MSGPHVLTNPIKFLYQYSSKESVCQAPRLFSYFLLQSARLIMTNILQIIQIASSILLIILVLLQRAQGDAGGMLGGEGGSFLQTRRGAERFLFILTVIIAIVFAGVSLAAVILSR